MTARWVAALIVGAPLLVQTPASALSCVPFTEQKPYSTFAGTIVQQRGDAYQLVVREVWSGPDLRERTWVKLDDLWPDPVPAVGQAWVIFADKSFRANTCTATPDGEGVDELRPDKVRQPLPPHVVERHPHEADGDVDAGAGDRRGRDWLDRPRRSQP